MWSARAARRCGSTPAPDDPSLPSTLHTGCSAHRPSSSLNAGSSGPSVPYTSSVETCRKRNAARSASLQFRPVCPRLLQQHKRPLHIGPDKRFRRHDRAVHVALGGKMHDRPRPMLAQNRSHQFRVANVAAHKFVSRISALKRRQVCRRCPRRSAGRDSPPPRCSPSSSQNEVRADEPRPAGDQNRVVHTLSFEPSIRHKTRYMRCLRETSQPFGAASSILKGSSALSAVFGYI